MGQTLNKSRSSPKAFSPLFGVYPKLHAVSVNRNRPTSVNLVYRNMSSVKTGILMLNMGGPRTSSEVHDFLLRLFSDRDIINLPCQNILGPWIAKRRTPSIQEKYMEIGGGSPIFEWSDKQGTLLCEKLDKLCIDTAPHKHYVGFRYAHPLTDEALKAMKDDGVKHCVVFSQYPQYSCSTSGSSMNAIHQYYKTNKGDEAKMTWSVIDRWCTNEYLAQCFAENIKEEIKKFPFEKQKEVAILFSAHSLPLKQVNKGDPYPAEVGATVQLVMKHLRFSHPYRLVWQSKVGPLPWLGPSTDKAIEGMVQRGKKNLILVPIAFTNEHIETLHELDIEYIKEFGGKVGAERIGRCPAPNVHPLFIEALTDEVKRHLESNHRCSEQFLNTCPLCDNQACFDSKKWWRSVTKAF